MNKYLFVFLSCFIDLLFCNAQIIPAPGAKLNYTQVMFEYEKVKGAGMYLVELIEDVPGASFEHCLITQKDSATATLIKHLEFGKKYQWRYAGVIDGHEPIWIGPYHFEIEDEVLFKKKLLNLAVTTNDTTANAGGLIINDATHTVIDRSGKTVWFLPKIDWQFNLVKKPEGNKANNQLRHEMEIKPVILDLRLTPYGTITYMTGPKLAECDLNGKQLWVKQASAPVSDIGEEFYNHVFYRLPNGHYIVMGREQWRKMPENCDFELRFKYPEKKVFNGINYAAVEFGTIIEYDKKGKVVWSWNSQDYLDSDPLTVLSADPQFNYILKAHANALSVDRKNEFVYMGFRDINRIIKIEKSTGKVVDSWGPLWPLGGGPQHSVTLHKQHDANILDDGNIAVFNNNDWMNDDSIPSVIIFSQQPGHDGEVLWKYDYNLDTLARRKGRSGGNVDQLKNGNLLVCTGNVNTIFEITRDKKIVWQASVSLNDIWGYNFDWRLYRAHCISSLYPCYFTFQINKDTITKSSPGFSIRLFNKGSEDDAYNIKISSGTDIIQQFTTDTIRANCSAALAIQPPKLLKTGSKLMVSITSLTNPDFERSRWIVQEE